MAHISEDEFWKTLSEPNFKTYVCRTCKHSRELEISLGDLYRCKNKRREKRCEKTPPETRGLWEWNGVSTE